MPHKITVSPLDEHNKKLLAHVQPSDWKNPKPASTYNMVVIGAGTAGLVTAAGAAGLGAKVALIERNLLGGDCLNVGCVPSKAILRSSRAVADIRNAEPFGIRIPQSVEVDFPSVMERMRKIRARISPNDSVNRLSQLGIDVFLGEGRFRSSNTMEVDGKTLRFKKAVIAAGALAIHPPIEGLAESGFLTNETIFNLTEQPRRLAVIGGGPIGCELAQAFSRLGSAVTLLEMAPQFLTREDPDAAQILAETLQRDGINVRLGVKVLRVKTSNEGKAIHFEQNGKQERVTVDAILVGAGRAPNVDGLHLEAAGVKYDKKSGVEVNDYLQTSRPNIYAAGDICSPFKFTHTADAMARIVIQNALFFNSKKASALTIPWCTYTDPEIAHVGMYEREAKEKGITVETFKREFHEVDRAIAEGETEGFVKIHVQKGTDKILGATIVARHAGEMISEITLAIVGGIGLGTISNIIHPYPTQAEAIRQVADAYNRTRLTPFVKTAFNAWLSWKR